MQTKLTQDQLNQIIADHKEWWYDSPKGKRANLRSADLSDANLRSADLRSANLSGADLRSADLSDADLSGAVSSNLTFLAVYGIGSANRQTLYIPEIDIVFCGCFKGTMAKFKVQVANNARDTHLEAYNNAIEYLEKQAAIYRKDNAN